MIFYTKFQYFILMGILVDLMFFYHDIVTPLDFWGCILAFTFDLNFDVSYKIVKENDYINVLIDRFEYKDKETKNRMQKVRKIINEYIDKKLNL